MGLDRSAATFDSFCGVELELSSGRVVLPALCVRDGFRVLRLAEQAAQGDEGAAQRLGDVLPRAVGLDPESVTPDDVGLILARCFDPSLYGPEPTEAPPSSNPDGPTVEYCWEDILADYAAVYGGPPRPTDPWPLLLALLNRTQRFDARARLRLLDSVSLAIGAMLAGSSESERQRDNLISAAYPVVGPIREPMVNNARGNSTQETP